MGWKFYVSDPTYSRKLQKSRLYKELHSISLYYLLYLLSLLCFLEAEKDPATAEFVDFDKTVDIPVAVNLSKMKTGA